MRKILFSSFITAARFMAGIIGTLHQWFIQRTITANFIAAMMLISNPSQQRKI